MADILGEGAPAPDSANAETAPDRRRPGRLPDVSPGLLPLLRNPVAVEIPAEKAPDAGYTRDELDAAKGIAVGIFLAVPLWCLIALAIWWTVG